MLSGIAAGEDSKRAEGASTCARTSIKLALAAMLAAGAGGRRVRAGADGCRRDRRQSAGSRPARCPPRSRTSTPATRRTRGKVQLQFPAVRDAAAGAELAAAGSRSGTGWPSGSDITVTPADVQKALNAITAQIRQGGNTATLSEVAVANGLPPDLLQRPRAVPGDRDQAAEPAGRREAAQPDLGRSRRCRPSSPRAVPGGQEPGHQGQPAVRRCYDYSSYAVVPAPTTLSARRPRPRRPPPTATQLTPKC